MRAPQEGAEGVEWAFASEAVLDMLREPRSPVLPMLLPFVAALLLTGWGAPAPASAGATLESLEVYPTPASIPPGGAFGFGAIATYSDGSRREVTRKAKFFASTPAVAQPLGKNVFGGAALGTSEIRATLGTFVSSENALLTVSPIASLEIEPDEAGVRLGTRVQFGATATLADGSEGVEVGRLLDWVSLDPARLSMGNGKKDKALSKGLAPGVAVIEARDPRSGVVAAKAIHVVERLRSVLVTPDSRVLQLDDGRRFQAIGLFESVAPGLVEADISFEVRWSSSDKAVATIDKEGRPRPRRIGETWISAVDRKTGIASSRTSDDGLLTVVGAVRELTVEPAAAELAVGEDDGFDAVALFSGNPNTFAWTRQVEWTSSDPAVASVDGDGDVRCESAGSATLSARDPKTGVTSTGTGGDALLTCR